MTTGSNCGSADLRVRPPQPRFSGEARSIRFASLLACACLAVGCGSDRAPPLRAPDAGEAGRSGRNISQAPTPTGFTEARLPCDGFDYAQLGDGLLTYSVQIHSDDRDLTRVLATRERRSSFTMREVLVEYSCQQLSTMDLLSVEMDLMRVLERSYQDETGEAGVINALSLHIESCE